VVAEEGGELLGAVIGFRPPDAPDTLFVWQIMVAERGRNRGLGRRMLLWLARHNAAPGVRYLAATVTPSNQASQRMFRGFARAVGAACEESLLFPAALFPGGGHEEERLFRIGPFAPGAIPGIHP
jgi:L-2,4-diaminobutyric acid acetyltransferase